MVRSILLLVCVIVTGSVFGQSADVKGNFDNVRLTSMLTGCHWRGKDTIFVKSAVLNGNALRIVFSKAATTVLLNAERFELMDDSLCRWLGRADIKTTYIADNKNLRRLLPREYDMQRFGGKPLVRRDIEGNMTGRHLALWNSHGRYYEQSLSRWEWQRARLFTSVEDLLTTSFVLPFLAPMLENAGAAVLLPRERDTHSECVVADNGTDAFVSYGLQPLAVERGYAHSEKIAGSHNPFAAGDSYVYQFSAGDKVTYKGYVEQGGSYGLHVSYGVSKENTDSVVYVLRTKRGEVRYYVNQQRGGGMWLYLGSHVLSPGESWEVDVYGEGRVSVDAVRLGGGMGRVERNGTTSGMASYMEGARYYLQSDGFDASTVYSLSGGTNDYTDDINARGEWVNVLQREKSIPIDAVVALHTDAGIAQGDTVIGTLTIVSTVNKKPYYGNRSRAISHSLAHAIESSVVNDMRQTWDTTWTERGIWDARYSEARRPEAPAVLIELLSHQNLNDMRYALHPQFRFDICRSIYKGLLRFFEGEEAVVQPLPVSAFGIEQLSDDTIRLSWQSTPDPLEASARPASFRVYADGVLLMQTADSVVSIRQEADGLKHEYYVVAVNEGGVSFPSRVMAACLSPKAPRAVVVDCNDRVSAPAIVKTEVFSGILRSSDEGVAWGRDLLLCGSQYDYDPTSQWLDDDCPGWGASYADMEKCVVEGNRRLCSSGYVDTLAARGFSVVSVSKGHFEQRGLSADVRSVRISLGKEKTTWYGDGVERHEIYTSRFMQAVDSIVSRGVEIVISGNYVGSEVKDKEVAQWVAERLGFKHLSGNASRTKGTVSVDAIVPARREARTVERYGDTNASAAVRYGNVVTYGYEE